MPSLQEIAQHIIDAAQHDRLEEALEQMKDLPHDKFTTMTMTSGQKSLAYIRENKLKPSERRKIRRKVREDILREMGITDSSSSQKRCNNS